MSVVLGVSQKFAIFSDLKMLIKPTNFLNNEAV
jgi:hypothetical protein